MAATPIFDFRDGEVFLISSEVLKKALKSQIYDVLQAEMSSFMAEVEGELQGQNAKSSSALFLSIMMNEHLSPKALLIRRCLERAVECQKEIKVLTYMHNNLTQGLSYKLNLKQLERFGLSQRDGNI